MNSSQRESSDSIGESLTSTPTRRNKRKMTEPKKRTDFSIKRLCQESDTEEDYVAVKEYPPDTPSPLQGTRGSLGEMSPPSSPTSPTSPTSPIHMDLAMFSMPLGIHAAAGGFMLAGDLSGRLVAPSGSGRGGPDSGDSAGPSSPAASELDERGFKRPRKNYKNMTRERRVEANARERSRVHTISAAFEALRRAVPSYSYNQKLSKLAILRIACTYIIALARLANMDYTEDKRDMSFAECVDICTSTIQTEGRARRRH